MFRRTLVPSSRSKSKPSKKLAWSSQYAEQIGMDRIGVDDCYWFRIEGTYLSVFCCHGFSKWIFRLHVAYVRECAASCLYSVKSDSFIPRGSRANVAVNVCVSHLQVTVRFWVRTLAPCSQINKMSFWYFSAWSFPLCPLKYIGLTDWFELMRYCSSGIHVNLYV
jgi:hypothetical protein